jgi:DNA-directed RNA polymerase alpha subunit
MKTTNMKKVFFISASLLFTAVCFAQSATSSAVLKSETTVSADASPSVNKANESLTNAKQRTRKARKHAAQEVAEKKKDVKQQLDNTKVDADVNAETSAASNKTAAGTKTAVRVNSQVIAPVPAVKTPAVCVRPIRARVTGNPGLSINK